MYKVSFHGKEVKRVDNVKVIYVTLNGAADSKLYIPPEIFVWATEYSQNIDYSEGVGHIYIKVTGKSVYSKEDKIDSLLGEEIAETRAKIYLYKFMRDFCSKVYFYYKKLIDGESDIVVTVSSKSDSLYNVYLEYDMLYNREKDHLRDLINRQSNIKNKN